MYDLVVLGGGSGGLNAAVAAATVGAKVALVEKDRLGGECTHTACVPSKALVHAARLVREVREAGCFGVEAGPPSVDFRAVMGRVHAVVGGFAEEETAEAFGARGVEVIFGSAAFEAYDTVVVDGKARLPARAFVISTGSSPAVPPIPGLREAGFLDNTNLWSLERLPPSLVVIGAGPVGIELGQAFARFGSRVTVLDQHDRVLTREDPDASALVRSALESDGVAFGLGVEVRDVQVREGRKVVRYARPDGGAPGEVEADAILVAAGRRPNVEGLGLEAAGIEFDPERGIAVDSYLRTTNRRAYAIGDVIGHHQWTHAAEREASVAFRNAVLGLPKKVDYAAMPWATFCEPEVATVGRLPHEAGDDARVYRVDFDRVDRARIDGRTGGFAKVVADRSGRVLGATVVGEQASLLIQEFVLAMEQGLTLGDLLDAVHVYPGYATLVRGLAVQHAASRLESGLVRRALRWFYGFEPRVRDA